MNICGVLVFANPARTNEVIAALQALEGAEVHMNGDGDGRIVVTVEDTECISALDSLKAIHKLDGVVSASLVYHNFEAAPAAVVHN